jgi:hypothetical protein
VWWVCGGCDFWLWVCGAGVGVVVGLWCGVGVGVGVVEIVGKKGKKIIIVFIIF